MKELAIHYSPEAVDTFIYSLFPYGTSRPLCYDITLADGNQLFSHVVRDTDTDDDGYYVLLVHPYNDTVVNESTLPLRRIPLADIAKLVLL